MSLLVPNNFNVNAKNLVLPDLLVVAVPNNANALAAGVPLWGLYIDDANPTNVYIRTA